MVLYDKCLQQVVNNELAVIILFGKPASGEETKFLSNQTYDLVVRKTVRLEGQGRNSLVRVYPPYCATQSKKEAFP